MYEKFVDAEDEYLRWVRDNQSGFVVNADNDYRSPDYPLVHRATHKLISSPKIGNFTNGRFFKVCSNDPNDLEKWAKSDGRRPLTPCGTCFKPRTTFSKLMMKS